MPEDVLPGARAGVGELVGSKPNYGAIPIMKRLGLEGQGAIYLVVDPVQTCGAAEEWTRVFGKGVKVDVVEADR